MSNISIKKALIIDDSGDYRQLLSKFFEKACPETEVDEYDPTWGKPPDKFPWARYELLILDYDLGSGENGLDWLRHYKTTSEFPPTIMLTAADNEELVVKAIRFGAQGFLRKEGLTKGKLQTAIEDALKKFKQEQEQASSQKLRVHVFNKEKFFESLELAKSNDAVFLIEINKYQALSESLGIIAADHFASFISDSISNFITESKYDGYMTRIGDSTVAMLIQNNDDKSSVEKIAKKLCEYFDALDYKNNNEEVKYFVNIGVTCLEDEVKDMSAILSATEKACRASRIIAENSYTLSGTSTDEEPAVEMPAAEEPVAEKPVAEETMAEDQEDNTIIINAVKEERMQPLFQPLVLVSDAASNIATEYYHARTNLLDPDNNIIEAKEFIPVLQKTKMLKTLDRWVIRNCVGELSKLNKNEEGKFGVLITLSKQSIVDNGLSDWISKLIDYVKMPKLCESIVFEIVTDDFLENQREAKLQINKMRVKLNTTFALRDVEDATTMETVIQQVKFEYIMFSPEHTTKGKMNQEDILNLATKAKANGALTVASKIDSGEYLAMAANAGVDYVFGYFVQPPMENIVAAENVEV